MTPRPYEVLADMDVPTAHRSGPLATNPFERRNGEAKRRTDVIGTLPNEESVVRPIDAILLEHNEACSVQMGRYMTLETIAPLGHRPMVCAP